MMAGRTLYFGGLSPNGITYYLDAARNNSYPGVGTTWRDISTSNKTATLVNSPLFTNNNGGGSIVFDGTDDYVNLGTFIGLSSTDRTFNFWVRWTALPFINFGRVVSFPIDDGTSDNPAFLCGLNGGGGIQYGIGGSPYDGFSVYNGYTLNNWINVCCTVSGKTTSGYFNSVFHSSATYTGSLPSNFIGVIGRYNNFYSQYMSGQVSFLQIYNRVLTQSEITQNFNAFRGRYGI